MKLNNKFVIIIPTWNSSELIIPCIGSIINQDFNDLGIIIRNDLSTDDTHDNIYKLLGIDGRTETYTKLNGKDIIYINNTDKLYAIGNIYESAIELVENKESIIGVVDGDDLLMNEHVVSKVYEIYNNQDKWLVWTQHTNSNGSVGCSASLPQDSVIYSGRNYWVVSHFRTSKRFLFEKLNKEDLIDPFNSNNYYPVCGDAVYLYPFIEMCGNEKSYFLNESCYIYNNELPNNDHRLRLNSAVKYGIYIKQNGKPYKKLTQ